MKSCLLANVMLVAAIAAGLGVAFVAKDVRPQFYDGRTLTEATGLPLLGTVTMIVREADKKSAKRSVTKFLAVLGALLGTYLASFVALTFLSARAG